MLYTKGIEVGQIWTSRKYGYAVTVQAVYKAKTLDGSEYIKTVRIQYENGDELPCGPGFLEGWFTCNM